MKGVTEPPRWRAFQLAFLLLNLSGLADPANPEREFVDLLFFPTGGGKTEAYLGLAAFAMVLRRLRNPGDGGRSGAGVSVIMRYTLRLLTLDQLGRAAGLVCALELERRKDTGRYGGWPFEIGLWVGKAGTPNRLGERGDSRADSARSKVSQYKNNPQGKPAPIPLESCPWCGKDFTPDSFTLLPDADHPAELRIACAELGVRLLRRHAASHRRRGRAALPPTCPPFWSPRSTSSPRCPGWASPVRSSAAPTATTGADSTVPPSRAGATA